MPNIRQLSNKPLIEAIFEYRWKVGEGDPHYPLFVGRLYDQVNKSYPFHQPLPASELPFPMAANLIQHRFRAQNEGWPLVQIGLGIVTINDTEKYIWKDFGERSKSLIKSIYESYPAPKELDVSSLTLRYLDAFDLEEEQDILAFLANKLKSSLNYPSQLFDKTGVSPVPKLMNVTSSFITEKPKGTIVIKFSNGKHKNRPALMMETAVQSNGIDLPPIPDEFESWVESAHNLTDDWFFKLIEGELDRRFSVG